MKCNNIKCNKEHDGSYGSGKFCSRGCANSRVWNKDDKQKKSISAKNSDKVINENLSRRVSKISKICKNGNCKKEFFVLPHIKKEYCSRNCAFHGFDRRKKLSLSTINAYKNGKKVYGGTTNWYEYNNIKVQGTYELRTCKILDTWKKRGLIKDWEYTKDRYKYVGHDKQEHFYLLDFKVFNLDDSFYYIETKGYKRINDVLKWNAVRNIGLKLEVWFKKNIEREESLI